jgi:type II secretion system protein N
MRRLVSRRRRVIPVAGCVVFAVVAFLVALRYTLPYAEFAQSMESRLRAQGLRAKIEGLGPGSLLGVRADRVTIGYEASAERKAEFRDVQVKLSVPNLLRFRLRATLEASAFGGSIDAQWPLLTGNEVSVEWADVDLRRVPFPPNIAAVGLRGFAAGKAEARKVQNGSAWSAGFADAGIRDTRFGPGNVGGFPLPTLSLGTGRLRLFLRDGKLLVETFRFEGGNLRADLSGTIGLDASFPNNPVEGVLSLNPDERAAADLGMFLAFFPGGRGPDGTYSGRISGSLAYPFLSPMAARR